ncbi:MAG: hypothetical protein ACI88H_001919 [Cocleimonas sp.]|jgi:hypothetical protein
MIIFNNLKNRDYKLIFSNQDNVIFDLSDKQILHGNNKAWADVKVGGLACVISSSRKVSTIYQITEVNEYGEIPEEEGVISVVVGKVIAKPIKEMDMTALFNKHGVTHDKLPNNSFSMAFNLANIGNQLDQLEVRTSSGACLLGDLNHS